MITFPIQTTIFNQCVVKCGCPVHKPNKHQNNNTCLKEISLLAQNMLTILESIVNIIRRVERLERTCITILFWYWQSSCTKLIACFATQEEVGAELAVFVYFRPPHLNYKKKLISKTRYEVCRIRAYKLYIELSYTFRNFKNVHQRWKRLSGLCTERVKHLRINLWIV